MRRRLLQRVGLAWVLSVSAVAVASCPLAGQLLAGKQACSLCPFADPPSSYEDTAACVAHDTTTQVCNPQASYYVAGTEELLDESCPLKVDEARLCAYQCIPFNPVYSEKFSFYVSAVDKNEFQWRTGVFHHSERFVQSISAMELTQNFTQVEFIGGTTSTSTFTDAISTRVNVTLSSDSVAKLSFLNLDMRKAANPVVRVNQKNNASLESLSINNCLLETVPFDGKTLTALKSLDLSRNNFAEYPQQGSIQSLTKLSLRENKITAFLAVFPSLEVLDLSENQLTSIPDAVYFSSSLITLDMKGNPLASSTFTTKQFAFLSSLQNLYIDGFKDTVSQATCRDIRLLVGTLVVCVSDDPQYIAIPKSKLAWYIIVPIVGTAAIMFIGFTLWYYRRKQRYFLTRPTDLNSPVPNSPADGFKSPAAFETIPVDRFSGHTMNSSVDHKVSKTPHAKSKSLWADEALVAYQVRPDDIEDLHQIGAGAFAVVWLVRYRQSQLLASKRLIKDRTTQHQRTEKFVAEIKLVAQLDHPSIVQFVGVAWTVASDLQALFEYMPGGDLLAYLSSIPPSDERRYWTASKVQLAIDVVEALVYVHSFTPALLHRDLKSKNILLCEEKKAKLTDFGVSRYQSENSTMTGGVGTGKWLAPEVLLGGSSYDHRSDIYSFGVVLCELDTHTLPYAELQVSDVAVLQMVVGGTVRPRLSDGCPPVLRDLVDRCLSYESGQRPSAMEVAYALREFAKTLPLE